MPNSVCQAGRYCSAGRQGDRSTALWSLCTAFLWSTRRNNSISQQCHETSVYEPRGSAEINQLGSTIPGSGPFTLIKAL